jgi:hypothetical protein
MEVDGHDVRSESLEERRTRLAKLLSRKNNPIGDGIQLSKAITGDGPPSFVIRAGCTSKALSRSASARGTSVGGHVHG